MTPYNSAHYEDEVEEKNCMSCRTPTLFVDQSQGDTICTSCGLVHSQHYRSSLPEWRDYTNIDPESTSGGTARAGSIVNESKWAGGLEPTALGKIYNPNGCAVHGSAQLDGYRRTIGKMKRVVDRWVEKKYERQVEEGRIAMKAKERRRENGKDNEEEQDWTGFGMNEYEQVARQRDRDIKSANQLLISEKWSLERALLLHGEPHEVPSHFTTYNPLTGEQPKDVEREREKITKRMDLAQKKASSEMYVIYKIIQKALIKINLGENGEVNDQVMKVISQFANRKGGFNVKGVSSRITTNKVDQSLQKQQRMYNKQRQMSALGAAAIFLVCKKNAIGRALAEICSCFQFEAESGIHKSKQEVFIKPKHLSKAMNELKFILPEYIESVTKAVGPPSLSSTSMDNKSLSSKVDESSTINLIQHIMAKLDISPTTVVAITKLVLHCKENNLFDDIGSAKTSTLVACVTYLVCDAGTTMQRLATSALEKNKCEESINNMKIKNEKEGEGSFNHLTQQQQQQTPSSLNEHKNKRKHIRPGASRISAKRQRVEEVKGSIIPDTIASSSSSANIYDLKPPSVTPEPFDDSIKPSPLPKIKKEDAIFSTMQSYHHWSKEKSWHRTIVQIEQSCNISGSSFVREYYRKKMYPKRKSLLFVLQDSCTDMDCILKDKLHGGRSFSSYCNKMSLLMSNISCVAPLMTVAK